MIHQDRVNDPAESIQQQRPRPRGFEVISADPHEVARRTRTSGERSEHVR
jgi:hypothetical protein